MLLKRIAKLLACCSELVPASFVIVIPSPPPPPREGDKSRVLPYNQAFEQWGISWIQNKENYKKLVSKAQPAVVICFNCKSYSCPFIVILWSDLTKVISNLYLGGTWRVLYMGRYSHRIGVTTMERLDQGHIHPLLEHPSSLAKSYSNRLLTTIRKHSTWGLHNTI